MGEQALYGYGPIMRDGIQIWNFLKTFINFFFSWTWSIENDFNQITLMLKLAFAFGLLIIMICRNKRCYIEAIHRFENQ